MSSDGFLVGTREYPDERTAACVIGALALVCIGLVLSVVVPVHPAEPLGQSSADERFAVGDADAFSANGSIVVGGAVRFAFDGDVAADGEWYQRVRDGGVVSARYHPVGSDTAYERLTVPRGDRAERRQAGIEADEDRHLVRTGRGEDDVTFVFEVTHADVDEPVTGSASVFLRSLQVARYDPASRSGSTSRARSVSGAESVIAYEPRSGWYEGRVSYRITGASGTVRVDEDTRDVRSANVSWQVTRPAGSYAEYVLARFAGDGPTTHAITFEYDPGDDRVERPAWVNATRSTAGTRGRTRRRRSTSRR